MYALIKSYGLGADCADSLYHELYHLTEGPNPTGDPYSMCQLFSLML